MTCLYSHQPSGRCSTPSLLVALSDVYFNISHSSGQTVILICIYLMSNDVEHLFIYLLAFCILLNIYSNPLLIFKLGYLSFFVEFFNIENSVCILDIRPLEVVWFAGLFTLIVSFKAQSFWFLWTPTQFFSLVLLISCLINLLPNQRLWKFIFSFKSFSFYI